MKIKLPKKFLTILLSAVTISSANAGYYQIGASFGDETNKTIKADEIPVKEGSYAPAAKDGSGTWTISDGGTIGNAVFVREGTLQIKDNDVSLTGRDGINMGSDGFIPLSVAGKDSSLEVEGAKLGIDSWGAAMVVGGIDGSGSLVLKNKAKLDNWNGFSMFIGWPGYIGETNVSNLGFMNMHASTATPEGDVTKVSDRYVGTYYQAESGYDRQYGRGSVTVTGGSYLDTGVMGALYMGEGSLIVEEGSTVKTGTEPKWNSIHTAEIGRMAGCTSKIEVKGESELHFRSYVNFGMSTSTKSTMLIDNSTLQVDLEMSIANQLFNSSQTDVEASVTLKNNSIAKLHSVKMGNQAVGCNAYLEVDATSRIEGLYDGSCIELLADTATIKNAGTIGMDIAISAGEVVNSGRLTGDISMDGGIFTIMNGVVAGNLIASSGTINLSGNVMFSGMVNLGDSVSELALFSGDSSAALTVSIAKDTTIVLDDTLLMVDGQQFVVGEGTQFIVDLGDDVYDADTQLFTLRGNNGKILNETAAALADNLQIYWTDSEGNSQVSSGAAVQDCFNVVLVPEPTTATLSLLALAGLAARRRRRS